MDTQFSGENEKIKENEINEKNDILNYKGYFVENNIDDEEEQKFFEFGAHFSYKLLYQKLEIIAKERKERKLNIEKKLCEKEKNEEIVSNKLMIKCKQKVKSLKSRNKDESDNILTYEPQLKQKLLNNLNQTIKKSGNKTQSKKNYNINNNELNKLNNKNKLSLKPQMKIRKRNNCINNINSGHINTVRINLYNKININEKQNNLTHNVPFISKIKYITPNKKKSIRFSKQKLYYQMLKSSKSNKIMKSNNNFLNKLMITNKKLPFSKYIKKTKQNPINISFSKNNYSNIKNSKNNINDIKMKQNIKKNNSDIKNKYKNNNLIKSKNSILSKKKIILNNKYRIPNNNYYYKALLTNKKPNLKNIDIIGNSNKNISRNNRMSLFNNKTVLNTDKNFCSLNNIIHSSNNYIKNNITNNIIINYKNKNIIPKFKKTQIKIKNKSKNEINNKNEKILNNTTKNNLTKNNKNSGFKIYKFNNKDFKINLSVIREKLKQYLNINKSKKYLIKCKRVTNSNYNINQKNNKITKKYIPKTKKESNDKNRNFNLLKADKKNNININININNQNNIILNNKLFGENNNSISFSSKNLNKNKDNDDIN